MRLLGLHILVFVILCSSIFCFAQNQPNLENGFKNYGSIHGSSIDSVNLTNGNWMLHSPLIPDVGQRGDLTAHYFISVNSKNWQIACKPSPGSPTGMICNWIPGRTGPVLERSNDISVHRTVDISGSGTGTVTYEGYGYTINTADGASHQVYGIPGTQDANGDPTVYETLDTSGYHLTLTNLDNNGVWEGATVLDRQGNQYIGTFGAYQNCPKPQGNVLPNPGGHAPIIDDAPFGDRYCSQAAFLSQITDANGNQASFHGPQNPNAGVDTVGRSQPLENSTPITDYSKCVSRFAITAAYLLNYTGPGGNTQQIEVCYAYVAPQTAFNATVNSTAVGEAPNSQSAIPWQIVTIILADGSKWTFDYDSYLEVTSVGLPTGGSITLTWTAINFSSCNPPDPTYLSRAVASRTLNDNNGHSATWNYTWGTPASGTLVNTATDPLGNDSVHTFTALSNEGSTNGCFFYETRTQDYQGTGGGRQLLKQVDTTYSSLPFGVVTTAISAVGNVVPTSIQTTGYPSGKVNLVTKTYDTGLGTNAPIFGNVVTEKEYDYGQGAPGALLRETDTTYQWQVNSAYLTAHTLDLPASVVVKDGSGNRMAETDYSYDEPAYLTASNISTQHGSAPASVRGNLTTVSRWLNTSSNPVVSHANWFDTGEAYQAIDPLGHTTTHSYSSTFAGAYPTQTCNALNQCVSGNYDFTTGQLTNFTDANGNISNYGYDFMSRLTSAQLPADPAGNHPQTTFTYSAANVFPLTLQRTHTVTTSLNDTVTNYYDGLGRVYQSQHATPSGNSTVQTTYDGLDHVVQITNPYYSTSDPTYGVVQTQYDALSRATQVTKQDGSISTVQYDQTSANSANGNCTIATDEAGNPRKTCADGLGRLIEVDEPGSSPGTAASGSLTINGTLQSTTQGGHGATQATGSVTISPSTGNDRSTQILTHSATSGSGTITITGSEQTACDYIRNVCHVVYDHGTVTIGVGTYPAKSYSYGPNDSAATVAWNLSCAFHNDSSSPVDAYCPTSAGTSTSVTLTARATGASTNYSFTTSSATSDTTCIYFCEASFFASPASGALTGGTDNSYTTVYDAGTVTITVNGHGDQVSFGQNDTASTIASNLAGTINGDASAFVNASASGNVVNLTSRSAGSAANASMASSYTYDTAHFSGAYFTSSNSGSALTGGTDAVSGNAVYDSGTITMAVGNFSVSVAYGNNSNSSSAQVASALAQALSTASGSPAAATASGSTISVNYSTVGTAGNVAVTVTDSSSNAGTFPSPSFSSNGTTLSGGTNPIPASLSNPFVTLYAYDALGNLSCVVQKGLDASAFTTCPAAPAAWRPRSFTYDSLSRLLTAINPESGQITYTYDADSNVIQKISPQANQTGTVTTQISYCYDQLHRFTDKSYTPQTPVTGQPCTLQGVVVHEAYDAGTNGIGHLTSLTDQAGSGSYSYDTLGRVASESRTIAGIQKSLAYTYNLDSSVATLTYPSGAVVTYTPDSAGRILSAVDNGNNISYATSASYDATGALTGFVSGHSGGFAGITNSFGYNKRLQSVNMSATSPSATVFSIAYDFHLGNGDNGNVYGITNNRDTSRNQTFTYDPLNRLITAQNAGTDCTKKTVNNLTEYWGNSYSYDAWGNLLQKTVTKCSAENLSVIAATANQVHMTSGPDYAYDSAGNMTHDATTGNNYSFDQENRIAGAAGYTYTYDADGNRVEKSNGNSGTIYWYMIPGIVAESDLTGALKSEYVFFDGERVARKDFPGGVVSYYFSDHLKTASVITDSAGTIKEDEDYYPWGGELQFVNNDFNHYKFTGKERDSETQLDYFGARYYGNWLGRFLTPDWAAKPITVPYANFGNPQSLNLYRYAQNNPTTFGDLDGHCDFSFGCAISLGIWAGAGVAADGGVKPFLENVGVGILKGTGNFFVNTAKTAVAVAQANSGNHVGAAVTLTSPGPKALRPSNKTQADVSKTTQVALTVASVVVPAATASAPLTGATAATETTNLFRAVGSAEAESIESLGGFSPSPTGSEFKGFFFNEGDASNFASRMTDMTGDTHSVVSAEAPTDLVNASPTHNAATEGPGVLIKNEKLPQVKVKDPTN